MNYLCYVSERQCDGKERVSRALQIRPYSRSYRMWGFEMTLKIFLSLFDPKILFPIYFLKLNQEVNNICIVFFEIHEFVNVIFSFILQSRNYCHSHFIEEESEDLKVAGAYPSPGGIVTTQPLNCPPFRVFYCGNLAPRSINYIENKLTP